MNRPRVLLADDHQIVVEGLTSLLKEEFELVGVVGDGHAMIEAARKLRPDVIVADIAMPRMNGIDAFLQLKKDIPRIKVVFLTMHHEVVYARRAIESGAAGFVLKHSAAAELIRALHSALCNKTYITPSLTGEVIRAMQRGPQSEEPGASLTPRQREIMQLLAEGRSAKEIAGALGISPRTVEFHKYQMMESLGLHNTAELILFALKHSLVTVS
jgi:DNA-binding NarL/FixJ family response regulator